MIVMTDYLVRWSNSFLFSVCSITMNYISFDFKEKNKNISRRHAGLRDIVHFSVFCDFGLDN